MEKSKSMCVGCRDKAMVVSGVALSSIRSARDAGVVWDESGVYVP